MKKSDIERIRERHNNIPQDGFPEVEAAVDKYKVRVTGFGSTSIEVLDSAYKRAAEITPGVKPLRVEQSGAIEENDWSHETLQGEFEFTYVRDPD